MGRFLKTPQLEVVLLLLTSTIQVSEEQDFEIGGSL